jgi:hypothetical protein
VTESQQLRQLMLQQRDAWDENRGRFSISRPSSVTSLHNTVGGFGESGLGGLVVGVGVG